MPDLSTRLESQEAIIDRGMKTFVEVGTALAQIRDQKLWMAGGKYASFDDYCKKRWDWNARYVQQVCKSAEVVKSLETHNCAPPKREAHARPLAKLPPAEQSAAWQEAVTEAEAEGKPVTAATVQKVVERRTAPVEVKPMAPEEADQWEEVKDGEQPAPQSQQAEDGDKGKPAKKLKNGREKVSPKDRKLALSLIGQLVRVLDRIGIYDKYTEPLSAMIKEVEI